MAGRPFAAAAIGVFLTPVGLAIAGAAWAGPSPIAEWSGGLAGLGLGLVVAVGIAKMLSKPPPTGAACDPQGIPVGSCAAPSPCPRVEPREDSRFAENGCPKNHQENRR